jgi:hypothetical protein
MAMTPISIDQIPAFTDVPAAYGAVSSHLQASGATIFDIVVAVVLINNG